MRETFWVMEVIERTSERTTSADGISAYSPGAVYYEGPYTDCDSMDGALVDEKEAEAVNYLQVNAVNGLTPQDEAALEELLAYHMDHAYGSDIHQALAQALQWCPRITGQEEGYA